MSAPSNPWLNTETEADAPFSDRGFGISQDKPPIPSSTVSVTAPKGKESTEKGQKGSSAAPSELTSVEKDGDESPGKPNVNAAGERFSKIAAVPSPGSSPGSSPAIGQTTEAGDGLATTGNSTDRDPSSEQTLSRRPSALSSGKGSTHIGSEGGIPSRSLKTVQWNVPRGEEGSPVESEPPGAPHETSYLQADDELYLATPQGSRSTLHETSDTSTSNDRGGCWDLDSLCQECFDVLKGISSSVDEQNLSCPPDVHPVTIKCTLWGTVEDARDIAASISKYLHKTVSQDVHVYAAVRRAATAKHREGRWYDVSDPETPSLVSRQSSRSGRGERVQSLLEQVFRWSSSSNKVLGKEWDRRHRDFKILIDFPVPVESGGTVEKHIISRLPNTIRKPRLKIIKSHYALHRLEWWARTHPAERSCSHASTESIGSRRRHRSSRRQ